MIIRRGDIYYADLRPVVGSEQGGVRPVLVIQNDVGNKHSPTVICAAITSRMNKAKLPTHVELSARDCDMVKDSVILLEQLRTIDKQRLKERICHIDNELLEQVKTEQIRLRKAEFELLQSQINPHFLFNSLNTISYFCREKPEKARELLLALSSYFRSMLEDTDYMVTLDTELEHVKAYTMLEEARFEKRLSIEINADPETLRSCVPNLILQPIVENAVHHGAMQREKGVGKVMVNVKREERSTRIDVIDNGPGMDYRIVQSLYGGEKVEHTGIGMMNVQQRLISLYGKSYGLQIVTSEEGTDVRMNIPDSAAGSAQQEKTPG